MFNQERNSGQSSTHTFWKTNLMLPSEQQRVKEREEQFTKRTSFEENLVNHYLVEMKEIIKKTGLQVGEQLPSRDHVFEGVRESKNIGAIEENCYFNEEEKWEITKLILQNQENFSIFMRLSSIFVQNKDELVYILGKILAYTSEHIEKKNPYKKIKVGEIIQEHRVQLMNSIVTSELVQAINPIFFSNVNEQPLMQIINGLFHKVLCLKQGIYEQLMDVEIGEEETDIIAEDEQNFFA